MGKIKFTPEKKIEIIEAYKSGKVAYPRCIRITARAQNVVNIILRNEHRKSGGCYTLRFCDGLNLFCL